MAIPWSHLRDSSDAASTRLPHMFQFVLLALATSPFFAQTAKISGLIFDPSILPIPNATFNIQRDETCATRRLVINQQGWSQSEESEGRRIL